MVEMEEEQMDAYLRTIFVGARNAHVGRLGKNVRALSVAHWRMVSLHFLLKLAVLQRSRKIIFTRNDAPKIIPDESLGDCFWMRKFVVCSVRTRLTFCLAWG